MNVLVDLEKRKTIIKSLIWQVAFRRLEERTMFKAKEIDEISDWFWDEDEDEVHRLGRMIIQRPHLQKVIGKRLVC